MKSIEVYGKNIDEALAKALVELSVTEDMVTYVVLEEGSKGFLNLIGTKPSKIKVTLKRTNLDEGKEFLENVLMGMGINAEVNATTEGNTIKFDLVGKKMGNVIGYRGETLDSLQYLVSLVVNKNHQCSYKRVVLDVENYRARREETLNRVADKAAYKVSKIRRPYKLEPMNPYERRVIHSALQDREDIVTYSEGEEPFRRVVVDVKSKR